jgi:hypothetical protein
MKRVSVGWREIDVNQFVASCVTPALLENAIEWALLNANRRVLKGFQQRLDPRQAAAELLWQNLEKWSISGV